MKFLMLMMMMKVVRCVKRFERSVLGGINFCMMSVLCVLLIVSVNVEIDSRRRVGRSSNGELCCE